MDFLGWSGGFLFVLLVGDSFFEVVVVFLVCCCHVVALAGVRIHGVVSFSSWTL